MLLRRIAVAAAVLVVVPALAFILLRVTQDGVLAGVVVDDVEVGGMSRSQLDDRVDRIADEALDAPVVVVGERGEVESTRGEVGVAVDPSAAADDAWRRGRQANPLAALADHVRARLGGTVVVDLVEDIDDAAVEQWANDAAAELSAEARPAGLRFHADPEPPGESQSSRAEAIEPAPGHDVDGDDLADRLREALAAGGAVHVDAPGEESEPVTTQADLEAVLPDARRAVSGRVRLRNPTRRGDDLVLTPAELASLLEVRTEESAPEGERLVLRLGGAALQDHLGDDGIARLNAAPREARFVVEGDSVEIRGGQRGYRFAPQRVAAAVLERATSRQRTGELPGRRPRPDLTRSEARDLGISERVSQFTTEHACCESRVTNIQRIADIVDGVLIRPGDSFSINDHVGPRTREKGFVEGGVIEDGEFEEAVGGGISQFATTFFNAAFFAGIQVDDFQPHSYYISRYPMGHESTIAYGVIDVAITNDSPHGILVKTSYTDTSITVSFYSTEWAEVDVETSGRRNVVEGDVRDGFDITFTRRITYPDGSEEVEEYFHRYQPENADD